MSLHNSASGIMFRIIKAKICTWLTSKYSETDAAFHIWFLNTSGKNHPTFLEKLLGNTCLTYTTTQLNTGKVRVLDKSCLPHSRMMSLWNISQTRRHSLAFFCRVMQLHRRVHTQDTNFVPATTILRNRFWNHKLKKTHCACRINIAKTLRCTGWLGSALAQLFSWILMWLQESKSPDCRKLLESQNEQCVYHKGRGHAQTAKSH